MTTAICLALMGGSFVAGFIFGTYYVYAKLQELAYQRLLVRREQFIKEQISTIDNEYAQCWEW